MMSEDPLICTDMLTDSNASFLEFSTKYLALFDNIFHMLKYQEKLSKISPISQVQSKLALNIGISCLENI